MKKLLWIVLCMFMLCGCEKTASDVNLLTIEEAQKQADKYGKNEYLGAEEGQNMITYRFKDDEYEFEYEIVSQAVSSKVDIGLGAWYEKTSSDFDGKYRAIMIEYMLDENLTVDEYHMSRDVLAFYSSKDHASRKDMEILADRLSALDSRKYYWKLRVMYKRDSYEADWNMQRDIYHSPADNAPEGTADYYSTFWD